MSVLVWARRIFLVGALALGGLAANAATVTFDFTGNTAKGRSLSFSNGALDLLVVAGHFNPVTGAVRGGGKVIQATSGLGEKSRDSGDSRKLDGKGSKELLTFSFSSNVKIENITFRRIGKGSRVTGFVDGVMLGSARVRRFMDVSALDLTSDSFGIGAGNRKSAFRIASITVSTVPLPAGGLLLASGLAGLSCLRRRRSA